MTSYVSISFRLYVRDKKRGRVSNHTPGVRAPRWLERSSTGRRDGTLSAGKAHAAVSKQLAHVSDNASRQQGALAVLHVDRDSWAKVARCIFTAKGKCIY